MTVEEIKEELKRLNSKNSLDYALGFLWGLWKAKALSVNDYCKLNLWICENLY